MQHCVTGDTEFSLKTMVVFKDGCIGVSAAIFVAVFLLFLLRCSEFSIKGLIKRFYQTTSSSVKKSPRSKNLFGASVIDPCCDTCSCLQHNDSVFAVRRHVVGASFTEISGIQVLFSFSDVGPPYFRRGACEGLTLKADYDAVFSSENEMNSK